MPAKAGIQLSYFDIIAKLDPSLRWGDDKCEIMVLTGNMMRLGSHSELGL